MTAWDPIGVGDVPEAWDEYDDYALQVARRLYEAANADEAQAAVAEYLTRIEIESMGIAGQERATSNEYVAAALVAWHEWSYRRSGRPPTEWPRRRMKGQRPTDVRPRSGRARRAR
jgi:hypothetical protein